MILASVVLQLTDNLPFLTSDIFLAILVLFGFLLIGYGIGRVVQRLMESLGVPDLVEGTTFERSAQGLGSSTVSVTARIVSWFIYGVGVLVALHILGLLDANLFWQQVTLFVPRLFVAVLVLIIGIVVGDKVALVLTERLKSVKVPEIKVVSAVAKYSIIFLAVLIALGQLGVATHALLIVLAAYAFGVVFLSGIACKDILQAGAAGTFLLLRQPFGIGDNIRVNDREGIVQEIELFTTRIETNDTEYIIPNDEFVRLGFSRMR